MRPAAFRRWLGMTQAELAADMSRFFGRKIHASQVARAEASRPKRRKTREMYFSYSGGKVRHTDFD